jgi:hypothetical protein
MPQLDVVVGWLGGIDCVCAGPLHRFVERSSFDTASRSPIVDYCGHLPNWNWLTAAIID